MSLTPGDVRQFLRDYGPYNILLDAVEFTEDDIAAGMRFTSMRYNALTPVTTFNEETFPNEWLMLIGVCAHLLQSEAFLQLRNQATYRDGDIENIGADDKFSQYTQLSDKLSAEWTNMAQKIKQQQNMESAYGSLSSGYRWLRTGMRNVD